MIGAIIGDMVGAPFEFGRSIKTKEFPLFCEASRFTDDTAMTIAIADALMETSSEQGMDGLRAATVRSMQYWGRKYPDAGYGGRFRGWLSEDDPKPYRSYGNGSAMRVSPAGWLYDSLEKTREAAVAVTDVTHDHPEGIKGAEATASAIWLARMGAGKEEIRTYTEKEFGYDLSRTLDEIRPGYHHEVSCQKSVPESIIAFLEGDDFEDVVRGAVSLGGDTDTQACIAGSIAEAYYGVPEELQEAAMKRLPEDMREVVIRFRTKMLPYVGHK